MKKTLLLAILAIAGFAAVSAQPRSIGLRAGNNWDLSYQHYIGTANMLTVEVGVPGIYLAKNDITGKAYVGTMLGATAAVIYDMIDPWGATIKWNKKGEWHWYMGSGIKGGIYGYNDPKWTAGFATHLGIEYGFEIPIILFFDSRATFGATNLGVTGDKKARFDTNALSDLAIGIRYRFH